MAGYWMPASKNAVDDALEGQSVSIEFGSPAEAEQFAVEVRRLKAVCEVAAE